MPVQPVQQSKTWKMRAPMIPPTTPHVATALASASSTPSSRTSFVESHTPKKIPTAVKMPCHASMNGPKWMFGSRSMVITGLAPVTLLELPAAPTPARVIPSDLLVARAGRGDVRRRRVAVRAQVVPAGRGGAVPARRRRVRRRLLLLLLRLLGGLHRDAHDRLRHASRDARAHLLEELVRLALVRDERVLLAVAAQIDPLSQLLHGGEVLDPVRVDRAQEHPALDRARDLRAEHLLARLVGLVDELGHRVAEGVLRVDVLKGRLRDIGAPEERAERRGELVEVPVLRVR